MKNTLKNLNNNLFLHTSDTELTKFCTEVLVLGKKFPKIYEAIIANQDTRGQLKKQFKLLDQQFIKDQTPDLPGVNFVISKISADNLSLETGRPRMAPEIVLLFTCLREYYGSVTDREVCDRFKDSITLYIFFSNLNIKMPAPTTILENINSLSPETRDLIMKCQLEDILKNGLDDFNYALFDSTSVEASSCWLTDAGVIFRLLERVYAYGEKLEDFGISSIPQFYFKDWLKTLKELLFKINNTQGTKKSPKAEKVKPLYCEYLKTAHKAYEYLVRMFEIRSCAIRDINLQPSTRFSLDKIHNIMEDDLLAISSVLYYSEERIFNNVKLPSSEKIISLSDTTATFIKKGQRTPVIGYKPQLAQSKNGFVTGLLLEKGNIADSKCLLPLVKLHKENTGIIPDFISADDGYSSGAGRNGCLEFGVRVHSKINWFSLI